MTTIFNAATHFFSSKPTQATFLCTNFCNSRCNWCNSWKLDSPNELTLEEIDKIFSNLYNFGIRMIYLSGGEPLLRKDIISIIDTLSKKGFEIILTTNGLLLNEKNVRKLIKYKNLHINVSLDTLDKELYKKIRGVDALDLVLRNLKGLKRMYPDYPLRTTMTVSKINYKEVDKIIEFCKKNKIYFSANPYFWGGTYREGEDKFAYPNKREEIKQIFSMLAKRVKKEKYISGFSFVYAEVNKWVNGNYNTLCDAGTRFLWVGPTGDVAACQDLNPFANLRKDNLNEEWKKYTWEKPVEACCKYQPCFIYCTRTVGMLRNNKLKFVKEVLNLKRLINYFRMY
ncbi:MAG: radical SAM protein [archaeon]